MKFKLSEKYNYKKTLIFLAVMATLLGALTSLASFLAVPFAAAYIALTLVVSFPKKHGVAVSALISVLIIAISAFSGGIALFSAILSVVIGLSIGLTYVFGRTKTEAVVITALLTIITALLGLWIFAAESAGGYGFDTVRAFYSSAYSEVKTYTVDVMRQRYSEFSADMPKEEIDAALLSIELYFDNLVLLLPALFVIFSLIISGFAFKVFGLAVYKYADDPYYILRWRFASSNVFAIFYVVLAVMNIFVSGKALFAVSVANLYSIFNFVFAYVGFNFTTVLLSQKVRPGVARVLILAAVLIFSSAALQILAVGGVIFTFIFNKTGNVPTDQSGSADFKNERENDNEKQ